MHSKFGLFQMSSLSLCAALSKVNFVVYYNSGPEAHYVYPNGDEVSNVEVVYICRDYKGEIRPQPEEIEEIRYFSVDEIRMEEISPPIRPVMRKYKETFR